MLVLRYQREMLVAESQRIANDHLGKRLTLEGFFAGYGLWGSTLRG